MTYNIHRYNSSILNQPIFILNVTNMTTHNGPGYRTLVQFKGCPLRCVWCSTPESQLSKPEIGVYKDKCKMEGNCLSKCPTGALSLDDDGIVLDRNLCTECGECLKTCYSKAIFSHGYTTTVGALADRILRQECFFSRTGGGITFSGGEPLFHIDQAYMSLLDILKDNNISMGFDTTGHISEGALLKVLPYADFFLWDIKALDPVKHKELTGVDNALILKNLHIADEEGIPLYIRCVMIPGMTDDDDSLHAICKYLQSFKNIKEIDVIPFHKLGTARYTSLGRTFPLEDVDLMSADEINHKKELVESYGYRCLISG